MEVKHKKNNLTDFELARKKRIIKKRVRSTIKFFAFAAVAALLIFVASRIDFDFAVDGIRERIHDLGKGEGYPYPISLSNQNCGFAEIDNDIMLVTDDGLLILNKHSKKIRESFHTYTNPVFRVYDNKAIFYDIGSDSFSIEGKLKTIATKKFSDPIMVAAIGGKQTVGIVTDAKGYRSQLTVFDRNMEQVFQWFTSSLDIFTLSIAADGRRIVAVGYSTDNGSFVSSIIGFDITKEQPLFTYEIKDSMIIDSLFCSKNSLVAVGDNKIVWLDLNGNKLAEEDLTGEVLTKYSVSDSGNIVIVTKKYSSSQSCDISVFDKTGKKIGSHTINSDIKSIDINQNTVYLLARSKAYVFDTNFRQLYSQDVKESSIAILGMKDYFYLLSYTDIEKINIR